MSSPSAVDELAAQAGIEPYYHDVWGGRHALSLDTKQPEAQYNLGYVMLERGHPDEAVRYFKGAIASDPQFADAYFNLAMAYEQAGDPAKAAAAIVATVESTEPPAFLLLGPDALAAYRYVADGRASEIANWERLTTGTNFDS